MSDDSVELVNEMIGRSKPLERIIRGLALTGPGRLE
jgi:hypothetical protein